MRSDTYSVSVLPIYFNSLDDDNITINYTRHLTKWQNLWLSFRQYFIFIATKVLCFFSEYLICMFWVSNLVLNSLSVFVYANNLLLVLTFGGPKIIFLKNNRTFNNFRTFFTSNNFAQS